MGIIGIGPGLWTILHPNFRELLKGEVVLRIPLPRTSVNKPSSDPHSRTIMGGMNDPHAQPLRQKPTELDLKILDVLREAAQSVRFLAETLSQSGEQVGVALAPYDRGVGHNEVDDQRDVAGLVVLLVIALLTAVCAAYSLLTAAGVLGDLGIRTSENTPSTL
jgi:hypothetical protein